MQNIEDEVILTLEEAFPEGSDPDVAVRVKMLNINHGHNRALMEQCRALGEYAWLIDEIRRNMASMELMDAVSAAIHAMPGQYQIKSFLANHESEVKNMLLTEYNEEETMNMFKEEARAEGREEGREEGAFKKAKAAAIRMRQKKGMAVADIADIVEYPVKEVTRWLTEAGLA